MDANFWKQKWIDRKIGFHREQVNPALVNYFKHLSLEKNSRLFLPLCGKTRDIAWLLEQGIQIVGAELSEIAITELFSELNMTPKIQVLDTLKHYSAKNIDIFVGDIFQLQREQLGPVDAIYDRAALVALPKEMRARYTQHLMNLSHKAQQLLLCFIYDQTLMNGPPFSISEQEVKRHYESSYTLTSLSKTEVSEGLKKAPAHEQVWLLKP